MKMRKIAAALSAMAVVSVLVSCDSTEVKVKPEPDKPVVTSASDIAAVTEVSGEVRAEVTEAAEPQSAAHNPLTGEWDYNPDAIGKRPVAVMINNITQSFPQWGIGSADYIYEAVVEGGITRLMAVFADYTSVPTLCSVRSCRYYYPLIANGLDAVYCHWGTDMTIAKETLERLGIDRFDGSYGGEIFYNDAGRLANYATEHTGCLDGSMLKSAIEKAGYRTEAKNKGTDAMKFAPGNDFISISDDECTEVTIKYSWAYYSTFTYDENTKTYLKQHAGAPHMDGATNEQLSFTNVFALITDVAIREEDGYRMNVGLSEGEGYYISGGRYQKIKWKKSGDDSNFVFTDFNTGEEITVNRGKCYIGLTDNVSL